MRRTKGAGSPVADEQFTAAHLAPSRELVRPVEGVSGEVEIVIRFDPRPKYGAKKADIRDRRKLGLTTDVPGGEAAFPERSQLLDQFIRSPGFDPSPSRRAIPIFLDDRNGSPLCCGRSGRIAEKPVSDDTVVA